jgi:acetyl-CoA carboxylase carboxyltransferase component
VPKITLIMGHSFGAGHYALCGRAYDPRFLFAWPCARYAVMGGPQAARTMLNVQVEAMKRQGKTVDPQEVEAMATALRERYDRETDIRYAGARGWIDAILDPATTRDVLIQAFEIVSRPRDAEGFSLGVYQV